MRCEITLRVYVLRLIPGTVFAHSGKEEREREREKREMEDYFGTRNQEVWWAVSNNAQGQQKSSSLSSFSTFAATNNQLHSIIVINLQIVPLQCPLQLCCLTLLGLTRSTRSSISNKMLESSCLHVHYLVMRTLKRPAQVPEPEAASLKGLFYATLPHCCLWPCILPTTLCK